jgi:hypothetical protein
MTQTEQLQTRFTTAADAATIVAQLNDGSAPDPVLTAQAAVFTYAARLVKNAEDKYGDQVDLRPLAVKLQAKGQHPSQRAMRDTWQRCAVDVAKAARKQTR